MSNEKPSLPPRPGRLLQDLYPELGDMSPAFLTRLWKRYAITHRDKPHDIHQREDGFSEWIFSFLDQLENDTPLPA
ncbi:hypothetical protein [Mangrovibacter phragmitis]|uniref:hypothetical protein n=1 Tax=Mangrovibacter phragmitis TaxID=1691903 RepID=UPI00336A018E